MQCARCCVYIADRSTFPGPHGPVNERDLSSHFNTLRVSCRKSISPKDSTWSMAKISKSQRKCAGRVRLDRGVSFARNEFLEKSRYAKIAYHVATTLETVHLNEITPNSSLAPLVSSSSSSPPSLISTVQLVADGNDSFELKNLLCVPILDGDGHVIGVCQVMNKLHERMFTDDDVVIIEVNFSLVVSVAHSSLSVGFCRLLWSRHSQHASIRECSSSDCQTERRFRSLVVSRHCFGRGRSTSRSHLSSRSHSTPSLCLGIQRHDSHRRWNGARQYSHVRRVGSPEEVSHLSRDPLSVHVECEEELSTGDLSQLATCLQCRPNDVLHADSKQRMIDTRLVTLIP